MKKLGIVSGCIVVAFILIAVVPGLLGFSNYEIITLALPNTTTADAQSLISNLQGSGGTSSAWNSRNGPSLASFMQRFSSEPQPGTIEAALADVKYYREWPTTPQAQTVPAEDDPVDPNFNIRSLYTPDGLFLHRLPDGIDIVGNGYEVMIATAPCIWIMVSYSPTSHGPRAMSWTRTDGFAIRRDNSSVWEPAPQSMYDIILLAQRIKLNPSMALVTEIDRRLESGMYPQGRPQIQWTPQYPSFTYPNQLQN